MSQAKYALSVTAENGELVKGFLKKADRPTIARAMSLIAQTKVFEAGEFVLENCLLEADSDPRLLSDEDIKCAAAMQAVQAVQVLDGELKKL